MARSAGDEDDGDDAGGSGILVVTSLGGPRRALRSGPEGRTRPRRLCAIFAGITLSAPSRINFGRRRRGNLATRSKRIVSEDRGGAGGFHFGPTYALHLKRLALRRQSRPSEIASVKRLPMRGNSAASPRHARARRIARMKTRCRKASGTSHDR